MKRTRWNFIFKNSMLLLVMFMAGCQSYQPRPLDLAAHAQAWHARTAASDEVRAFAAQLAQHSDAPERAFGVEDGLSVDEAQVVAVVFNPDLRLARLRAGVAKAAAEHAGLWEDPRISVDLLRIVRSVPDPWVIGSALSFTIPISGRLEAAKAVANAGFHAALDRVAEQEWETRRDLREAWSRWSAMRIRLEQMQRLVESLDSIAGSTRRLAELGELPAPEAALFTIEQATRQAELRRLQGDLAELEQQLRGLMGLSPTAPVRLTPSLAAGFTQTPTEAAAQELLTGNLTLARLRSEYAAAEASLLREVRKQYPDLEIGPQYESDEGQSRIGFVGAIPLPILNANKGGIAEARAERELAQAAYETQYERTIGLLSAQRLRLAAARADRQAIEQTLVELADRQVRDAQRLLELGEGSGLVLLESLVRAHEVKLQLIEARLRESLVESEITFLQGPAARQGPTTPEPRKVNP